MTSFLDPHWADVERLLADGLTRSAVATRLFDSGVRPPAGNYPQPFDTPESVRRRQITAIGASISRQVLVRRANAAEAPRPPSQAVARPSSVEATWRRFDKVLRSRRRGRTKGMAAVA